MAQAAWRELQPQIDELSGLSRDRGARQKTMPTSPIFPATGFLPLGPTGRSHQKSDLGSVGHLGNAGYRGGPTESHSRAGEG